MSVGTRSTILGDLTRGCWRDDVEGGGIRGERFRELGLVIERASGVNGDGRYQRLIVGK